MDKFDDDTGDDDKGDDGNGDDDKCKTSIVPIPLWSWDTNVSLSRPNLMIAQYSHLQYSPPV